MFRRRRNGKPVGPYYFRHPVTGRKHSSETTDRKRAEQLERDLKNEAHDRSNGKYVERWEEAANRWMELNQHLYGVRSQRKYHAFWMPHLKGMKLSAIDEQYVHRVIVDERPVNLKERVPANSTANLYVMFVAKILRFGKIVPPKFYKYPPPKTSQLWLRQEQWPRLRETMPDELRRVITFTLATGLRIDNVIHFQWSWLHGQDDKAYLPIEVTKTDQDYGIPLNRTAMAVIAEVRRQAVRHATHVFTFMGQPWEYRTLLEALKRACTRSALPVLTPHRLRHTFASWLAQEDVSDAIRRRLGCWQLGAGADKKYLHFDVERLRRFAEMLDPLLSPPPLCPTSVSGGGVSI